MPLEKKESDNKENPLFFCTMEDHHPQVNLAFDKLLKKGLVIVIIPTLGIIFLCFILKECLAGGEETVACFLLAAQRKRCIEHHHNDARSSHFSF